ncbi:hypothetical protein BJ980_000655 [Nocardioides daedukensis]|uniref:DUF3099 domain-containing protein n=1 Tax=Nocardioides daedukensis TaxID=634462 RepID=A0A7Y9UP07_9ACTN|nr:DUF3099 domain-containing protein [Nocardioides daedukensis]NYG57732.1 hypothetical protein [Nocardioides daedukensis]
MATRDERSGPEAVRITTAAPSRGSDIAARQKRYLFSMAIRTACFVGAVAVGPGWLRWVLIAGAVVLPYVAVVLASSTPKPRSEMPLRGTDWLGREIGPTR